MNNKLNEVHVKLKNCYGINKLDYNFDFSKTKSYVIYAQNGTMKTSFAKTLMDYSKKRDPDTLKFSDKKPELSIKNKDNQEIRENIFVIESAVHDFRTDKMSILLVNKELKDKHSEITQSIDKKKNLLIEKLQKISKIKNNKKTPHNLESTFTKDIKGSEKGSDNPNLFLEALLDQKSRVEKSEKEFLDIPYNVLFNDKTETVFGTKNFAKDLENYMSTFNKLISSSTFFKRGVFNHTNADIVAKQLTDNGFFKANHKVTINTKKGPRTISTAEELTTAIEEEKSYILNDQNLKKSFEDFSKKLQKNEDTKKLAKYLEENTRIIEHLKDWQSFKKDIWASFLKDTKPEYEDFIETSKSAESELKKIQEQAEKESCKWEIAVKIFKERFSVPFKITIDNKIDVMLKGKETIPVLSFKYEDRFTSETITVEQDTLYKRLSSGEQRALYILNIIFEVEARKELNMETLFIFDDIADSFDYKNKYAIIQYLYELHQDYPNSYQIILTHNFDFFRTIVSRLNLPREYALCPEEITRSSIKLIEMPYQKDLFKSWKEKLENISILIASIPFIRNLSEYCNMKDEAKKLTALLHIDLKDCSKTNDMTVKDLEKIIKAILYKNKPDFLLIKNNLKPTDKVKDIIYKKADAISTPENQDKNPYLLENKIVLSIAIRLKTEEFIIKELQLDKNKEKYNETTKLNQTLYLIKNYQKRFPDKNKEILTQVHLIIPENIHINAFMYEPILDTGYESLVKLYTKIKKL